jgi:hypothetical protein
VSAPRTAAVAPPGVRVSVNRRAASGLVIAPKTEVLAGISGLAEDHFARTTEITDSPIDLIQLVQEMAQHYPRCLGQREDAPNESRSGLSLSIVSTFLTGGVAGCSPESLNCPSVVRAPDRCCNGKPARPCQASVAVSATASSLGSSWRRVSQYRALCSLMPTTPTATSHALSAFSPASATTAWAMACTQAVYSNAPTGEVTQDPGNQADHDANQ